MSTHTLKTWPAYFQGIVEGFKTFEIRWDDRGYQAGHQLRLREWNPDVDCNCRETSVRHGNDCARYTGRVITARIGWVTATTPPTAGRRPSFAGDGYVVLALCDVALEGHPWDRVLAASRATHTLAETSTTNHTVSHPPVISGDLGSPLSSEVTTP